jgi:hypothetical protein
MSATAASSKREADFSSSAAAKRARHESAEAADSCVAETEAAAANIRAGVIKKLTIKVTCCKGPLLVASRLPLVMCAVSSCNTASQRIDTMMLYLPPFCAQNFMGIEHFAATMAPGINILQGGDGSAVLQAIRFCLSNTYELTEEQIGLVRQQWHCATEVAITMYNTEDASEYGRYGPSITVKRLLGQQGATALQLISDAGQRITCDKAEVTSFACSLR